MKVPQFVLPSFFTKIGQKLPSMPPQMALVLGLNQLLKRGVLPADMSLLQARQFEINVLDAGLSVRFTATETKFISNTFTGEPDIRLSANTADFLKMMLREEDPDTLFFNRKLIIEGDTELGLIVKNLLDSIDWADTPLEKLIQL